MSGFALLALGPGKVRIFVSYDCEHDEDLMDRLVAEVAEARSGLEISGRSTMPHRTAHPTDLWDERLRHSIRKADQVVVLCGEHTELSDCVAAELRIAQEEERPYVLLWGRREPMCTRPTTAKPRDSMYSWTPEILQSQILMHRRAAARPKKRDGKKP